MSVFIPVASLGLSAQRASRPNEDLEYILINPPLTDPTVPYHSISYLVGAAREAGFSGYHCLDANVDSLNFLASSDNTGRLLAAARSIRQSVETHGASTRREQMRYRASLCAAGLEPDFMQRALAVFRDQDRFYDYATYRQAVMATYRWLELVSLDGVPGMFQGMALRTRGVVNLSSVDDLTDPEQIAQLTAPWEPYFDGPFSQTIRGQQWELVGFSVNYISQLPFALRMAQIVKDLCPRARVVFGGTEVCDDVKFCNPSSDVWRLFDTADAIVPGEGETALVSILGAVRDGLPLDNLPGTMTPAAPIAAGGHVYEDLDRLPTPAYDVWAWQQYWSPEPIVLYSPTRGCYWNKCTFCDYGLNTDRPTSPSRERSVDAVIADLTTINAIGQVVYFAVDAMSPRYLRRLAQAISEAEVTISWSAELRLERTFPLRGVAAELARAGCVAVSFGYESASQRILDLIDKGVRIDDVPRILTDLAEAGIGAQMMGFTGFPSEKPHEALETYSFLEANRDLWALAGIGTFTLTSGSIIAKDPGRFGITVLGAPEADGIKRFLSWKDISPMARQRLPGAHDDIPVQTRRSIVRAADDRPFVGGIDSSHSMLYFRKFGRALLPQDPPTEPDEIITPRVSLPVRLPVWELATAEDLEGRYEELQSTPRGADGSRLHQWLDEPALASPHPEDTHVWVMPTGTVVRQPSSSRPEVHDLISRLATLRGAM